MPTGDGLLVRLNTIDGGLAPKALIGLAEAAARHGNGIMEVTARGSLQIRGLTTRSAPRLEAEIEALGIRVRGGVPVETGPLAGLDPSEIANPLPLASRLRRAIATAGLGARLGPKVSVVIDGGGAIRLDGVASDVRLAAVRAGPGAAGAMGVGGAAARAGPVALMADEPALRAAMAILEAVAGLGETARGRDLEAAALAPISGPVPAAPVVETRETSNVYRLRGGQFAVPVYPPFGSIDAAALAALARCALRLHADQVRLAPERALLVCGLPAGDCGTMRDAATELGFVTERNDPRLRIAACPGAPACASGRIAAREVAAEIAASSCDIFTNSLTLHISGCAKGCARAAPASITLVGSEAGVGLCVRATARGEPLSHTPPERAARGLEQVASLLRRERNVSESFGDCLARLTDAQVSSAYGQE